MVLASDGASMWLALGSAFIGTICGALGWTISAFVGTPARRFLDLRGEVIRRLTEFANVLAQYNEIRDSMARSND